MRRLVAAVVAWLRFDVPSCCPHPDLSGEEGSDA